MPNPLSSRFIQVPAENEDDLLYRWPSTDIRGFSRVVVDADMKALFLSDGKVRGVLGPGSHPLDLGHTPFLSDFLDALSGGGLHSAQLIFVSTMENTGKTFGGSVDDLRDPESRLVVSLKTYGEYALKVVDPEALVLNLTGNDAWDVKEERALYDWVSTVLLRVLRTLVTQKITSGDLPILGLSAHSGSLEQEIKPAVNSELAHYGLELTRFGNFAVNLSREDIDSIKRVAKANVFTELAGSYENYVQGEVALGAAEGLSKGAPIYPQFLPRGYYPPMMGAVEPQPATNPQGAKFCTNCGTALTPESKFCSQCGTKTA